MARIYSDMPALEGRVITEGHADFCATNGHATHTLNGVAQTHCPRCDALLTLPVTSTDEIVPGDVVRVPVFTSEVLVTPTNLVDVRDAVRIVLAVKAEVTRQPS